MMPQYHLIASLTLSVCFYQTTKSTPSALLCLLSGIIPDADHIIDFWLYERRITFSKEIFQGFYEKWGKIPVLLHSIELLIPIWALAYALNTYIYSAAITIGILTHLLMDFLSYERRPLSYFLSYRIAKNFDRKFICAEEECEIRQKNTGRG